MKKDGKKDGKRGKSKAKTRKRDGSFDLYVQDERTVPLSGCLSGLVDRQGAILIIETIIFYSAVRRTCHEIFIFNTDSLRTAF